MNTNQPLFPETGVVALVPDRWASQWQARHQIAVRLARYFHLAWMDYPLTRREIVGQIFSGRSLQREIELPASFHLYQPGPCLPQVGTPAWLGHWTSKQRLRRARQLLLARGCSRIVLYLWRPEFAQVLDQVPHQLSCYHIDDEYSFSAREVSLDPAEVELIRTVDQVFIHSPALMARKGSLNPNTELVPNGVDYQAYSAPAAEPPALAAVPHPRIGYVGVLKTMLNWPLLLDLSARHPNWSFVFVGNVAAHADLPPVLSALAKRENVYLLGGQPVRSLPAYVQHCDVCIMPYRANDYTKYIYPLKLHEYLASGRPVVGARLPSIEAFDGAVLLAASQPEWSSAVQNALSPVENTSAACERRRAIARMYDWDRLVGKIAAIIAQRLGYSLPPDFQLVTQTFGEQASLEPSSCKKGKNYDS